VVGTPGFMAPEQARDEQLTPASDVFSLGATLLFAATGLGPYGHGDPGLLMVRAAENKVERIPKAVPAGLRRRLTAMLDPRPERRPSAAALLTGDQSALRRSARWTRGTGPAMAFTAFAAVAVVFALAVSGSQSDDDGGEPSGPADQPAATVDADDDGAAVDTTAPVGEAPAVQYPPFRDQIEVPLPAAGEAHIYSLPMDSPEGCPDEVVIRLSTTSPTEVYLQVVRSTVDGVDEDVLEDVTATQAEGVSAAFRPVGCGNPEFMFKLVVTGSAASTVPQTYRITREDS
jgi:Protein tyrosine and serine/threonine kinase